MKKIKILTVLVLAVLFSCTKSSMDDFEIIKAKCGTSGSGGTGGTGGAVVTPNGRWERYGSPNNYHTDLAVGNIPGQAANRVYMCEHPGSPSAGLYKGYINGTTITWDPIYGFPDAEFNLLNGGPDRTLYFGVGLPSEAGKYVLGSWTNTCPL